MKELIAKSPEETQKIAQDFIGEILKHQKKSKKAIILVLAGDLGSGKTTFAQGLAKGLRIKENVNSPTFVLIKSYRITPPQPSPYVRGGRREGLENFYHIDSYRIDKPWQMQELGWDEIINNPENIVAIEWPERIADILPEDKIIIKFEFVDKNKRKIIFE